MGELLHHNSGILLPREEYEELAEAMATVFRIGARFTPMLIERLDLIDGDADEEDDDRAGQTLALPVTDEQPQDDDGADADLEECDTEDSFVLSGHALALHAGPGCVIADPDKGVDDEGEQATWAFNEDQHRHVAGCLAWHHDDAEEDNEDCGQDEGEPDMRSYVGEGPGCPISDSDTEHDGREREDGF